MGLAGRIAVLLCVAQGAQMNVYIAKRIGVVAVAQWDIGTTVGFFDGVPTWRRSSCHLNSQAPARRPESSIPGLSQVAQNWVLIDGKTRYTRSLLG